MKRRWSGVVVGLLCAWTMLGAGPALADAPAPAPTSTETLSQGAAETGAGSDTNAGEEPVPERVKALLALGWKPGPLLGSLGDLAEIDVPEGVLFADGAGTRRFLELNENPTNGNELGMIAAGDYSWFMIFEFSNIGYVKDDEKAELDAGEILESLKEGTRQGNEMRKARGWGTVTLVGWSTPPKYDEVTHYLEWATRLEDDADKHATINHSIRLLGREGVMEVGIMANPEVYPAALTAGKKLLDGYNFKAGHKYSEWREGERIAAIGLTGLITGGAIAAAAKTGLLGKLGKGFFKLIAAGGAAVAAGLAKLFGKKKES